MRQESPRALLLLVFATALALRAAIGVWAAGRGEMEGLAFRYERDAYAMAAGYGFVSPLEAAPVQVDLIRIADSLGTRGEKLSHDDVPAMNPALWRPATLHPPGYAGFLAGVYRVFGAPLIPWAKAIQAVIDALACVLLFFVGRRFGGSRVGLFAAFCAALFPPLAYLVTSRVADALMPAFVLAVFALWLRGLDTRKAAWFALSGAALGLACLFRPDMLLFPTFLFLGALVTVPLRTALWSTALVAACAFVVLVPWGLRNEHVHGDFNVTTHAGGMALYQGIGQFPNPYGIVFDDDRLQRQAQAAGFEGIDDPRADRWFKARFLQIARENPGLLAVNAVKRVPVALVPLYHWGYDNKDYAGHGFYDYLARGEAPSHAIVAHPRELFLAYWDRLVFGVLGFGLLAANLALILFDPARRRIGFLLALPYLYLALSHLPIMLGARLLVPAVFGQFIALGIWIERLVFRREPEEFAG
jgi:4-amino-4-deoxy-L-arabinose transferase-like glycosyltransferase